MTRISFNIATLLMLQIDQLQIIQSISNCILAHPSHFHFIIKCRISQANKKSNNIIIQTNKLDMLSDDPPPKRPYCQLQQMAFQKYPYQINNKTFFCLQTYFQGQLLNGVDLQLKQAKGITSQPQKISYIPQNQQLILAIGSNIVSYNAQKKYYSLLTEVTGFVQILRTYSCKINNRTFVFWLQTDQQDLNMKTKTDPLKQPIPQKTQTQKGQEKITSINNLFQPDSLKLNKHPRVDHQISIKQKSEESNKQKNPHVQNQSRKRVKFGQDKQQKPKSKRKVRIYTPDKQSDEQISFIKKKKMRICIFDYQKRTLIHKQPIEIEQTQIISDIILFYTSEKIVGYVINDQDQERGKICYRKIDIDDSFYAPKTKSKRLISHKKNKFEVKKAEKFNVLNSIFQVPLLKYNGQIDQYLFKDLNTVYSLQVYQMQHEMVIGKTSSNNIKNHDVHQTKSRLSGESIKILAEHQIEDKNLSKQIYNTTNKFILSSHKVHKSQRQTHGIKICQQIQIYSDQSIIDMSISQVYVVILTNQFVRFFSIFNLTTLLFICQINDIKGNPPPISVQLNKSYLLLTHQNSTLVSSYTILQRKLKYNSTCQAQIQHCQSILKIYMNTYNCEVAILARQFEIQGRTTNILKSRKVINNSPAGYRNTYLDISLAYINFSSTICETIPLFLKNERFRNILTCKWHSEYLIQTQHQIVAKQWRQSFQKLKCSCLHPTGQYLIIGFNDCFKIYAVTQQGLQNTYMSDGVKDCQAITYAEYGEHFAVGSSNTIVIYNSYNCTKKLTLNLPVGALVQSLQYRNSHLICVLKTKRIIIYHVLLHYKQIFTFNPKNYLNDNKYQLERKPLYSAQNQPALTIKSLVSVDVSSLYYDLQLEVVIFSSGKKIFMLNTLTNESLGSYDLQSICCMEYNKYLGTLFLGTFTGQVIAFPWPNKPSNIQSQLPRFKFHSQRVVRIKLTSDLKHLITLGNDMSIYKCNVSYILNLKRMKGGQITEYKGSRNTISYCNFLNNKGICQFSHSQNTWKLQNRKQLQQQVVNTIFMLPEERMKQKQQLFDQLSLTKDQLSQQNRKQYGPIQQQSILLRDNVTQIKEDILKARRLKLFQLEQQKIKYNQQTSDILKAYSELNYQCRQLKLSFQQEIKNMKDTNLQENQRLIYQNQQKLKIKENQISEKQTQNQQHKKNFLQIPQIQLQKQDFLRKHLSAYQKQIQTISSKNGQLSCKNSSIEKQILVVKYRIEELKFVILNANSSIQKLRGKEFKQAQQKIVFQRLLVQSVNVDVSQMQIKYIKATKQLIQKNKVIDVSLNLYEKQKQILVQLQKTVQKTEGQIDRIVDSLQQQKQFMKYLNQRYDVSNLRYKELLEVRSHKKNLRNRVKLSFRKYVEEFWKFEKQIELYNNSKKNQELKAAQLMRKLKSLEGQTKEQQLVLSQRQASDRQSVGKSPKDKSNRKVQQKNQDQQNQSRVKYTTSVGQLMNLRKSTFNIEKQKKTTDTRCRTEASQQRISKQKEKQQGKNFKLSLRINHNKYKEQFLKYRKGDSLNKTTNNFTRQKSQKQQDQGFLRKISKKYHQLKTEANHKTQRLESQDKNKFYQSLTKINENNNSQTFRNTYSNQCEKIIPKQKQNVIKQLTTQDKLVSKIKIDRKLFMTSKKKIYMQNQDLINTYNSLTYDNKYFQNMIKACESSLDQEDKNYISNPVNARKLSRKSLAFVSERTNQDKIKSFRNIVKSPLSKIDSQQKLVTPFDKYLKNKQKKAAKLKTQPHQSQQFKNTQRQGFKQTLNKVTRNTRNSEQKRINTVPCVQFTF